MTELELQESNLLALLQIQRRKTKAKRLTPKERCLVLLHNLGIFDAFIISNKGYWSHRTQDCYFWEWGGRMQGVTVGGGCWSPLAECALADHFTLNEDRSEVEPNENERVLKFRKKREAKHARPAVTPNTETTHERS